MFLILDPSDFIQLCCFPIEDEQLLQTIRNALNSFDVLKPILGTLKHYSSDLAFSDMSHYSKVKITRLDLIEAGIPENWFIDSLPVGHKDTLQSENFKCQNIQLFGAFPYSRTKDIQHTWNPINQDLSCHIHDQEGTYQCWAHSVTTMIRQSWKYTLNQMKEALNSKSSDGSGTLSNSDVFDYDKEMKRRESSELYLEIRNLMMMIIIPKRIDKKDEEQKAYLRASIVRVSKVRI